MILYGREQEIRYKKFLATYPPVGGVIRVVIVGPNLKSPFWGSGK
jgi:hypothetical protein